MAPLLRTVRLLPAPWNMSDLHSAADALMYGHQV
jgi:hypothetical protein